MGLLDKVTDPLGVGKKIKKAVGLEKIDKKLKDPFGHMEKLEDKTKEALGYDFEKWHFKDMYKQIKDNPKRLLSPVPMVDPIGTKIGNKLIGEDYEPLVNQLGGPTEKRFQDYIAQGGDPKAARNAANAHKVAAAIASWYAGGALGAVAGSGAGAAGATVGPTTQAAITAGTRMAIPAAATALDPPVELVGPAWTSGPGEYLSPLGGLGRMYTPPATPSTYGLQPEPLMFRTAARGGLAQAAPPRYRRYR